MHAVRLVSLVLLIIGGLNWGLVGVADLDLVAALFGPGSPLSRIVYVLVGLAAILMIVVTVSSPSTRTVGLSGDRSRAGRID